MNVKRFTARNSREALRLVREALGDDAGPLIARVTALQDHLGLMNDAYVSASMARLLRRAAPRLKVLSHSEIPETHSIRIGSIIGSTA